MATFRALLSGCIVGSLLFTLIIPNPNQIATAQSRAELDRLEREISERGNRLEAIVAEIARYEAALQEVGAERSTLEQAIRQLELERGRIQADIRATQQRIDLADLTIEQLLADIQSTETSIQRITEGLADNIRQDHQAQSDSLLLVLLRNNNLAEFWNELETKQFVRSSMFEQATRLQTLRAELKTKQAATEQQRNGLITLRTQYSDQNVVLTNNRAEQAELLRVTQNEEAAYQQMLAERQAARDQIVREVREFESQLRFILDPTTIPSAGTTVFDWPLANIRITQLFGGTEFAARNPSIYAGRPFHPGVDFGAPRGTPILAPLAGTIRAVGNTDLVPGCFSWGKWILVDHANGLSTLYAHLDHISVQAGQRVGTGEIIGYTGNTGFSTGPHLHFSVMVSEAVTVRQFNEIRTTTSCGAATTPIAAHEAWLDPILYLPPHSAQPR